MRVLSDGRERGPFAPYAVAALITGTTMLALVGGFVTVRALVEWLT